MRKVAIIGVGQSKFVRSFPGSIRELAFQGFKDATGDAGIKTADIDASVVCSAPEYDKQRSPAGVFADQGRRRRRDPPARRSGSNQWAGFPRE